MGQKVNPVGLRVGVIRTWDSRWYSEKKQYSSLLLEDLKLRRFIETECFNSGIAKVVIERTNGKTHIDIYSSRPGFLIGKGGAELEKLKSKLLNMLTTKSTLTINIISVRKPELDAKIVADNIATQIEKRVSYRRAMKKAMQSALKIGALGIRVNISGRINGAEIARMEWYREGRVPLHTLRSDVDYALGEAKTTYGVCGIKVWIYRGDTDGGNIVSIGK